MQDTTTTMPPSACACDCGPCATGDCLSCAHEDGAVCDCEGCSCMQKPETPMAA